MNARCRTTARRFARPPGTVIALGFACLFLISCKTSDEAAELLRLKEENARLREALANASRGEVSLVPVAEFTVGLAAAERGFDDEAFFSLLRDSLRESSIGDVKFTVAIENDEQQIAKVRGMLVQQYLSEQKVPVRFSNLTYKLKSPEDGFLIGGTTIPSGQVKQEQTADGLVQASFSGPVLGQMERDGRGRYSIAYADTTGRTGRIPVAIEDVEVFDPEQPPKVARQGDISVNWQLVLEKIQVYRVNHFHGDFGQLMHRMRYPKTRLSIQQYQTIRDSVFLFGYGPYITGLVNRLRTPSYIDTVEVFAVSPATFEALEPGVMEKALTDVLGREASTWVDCQFVEFSVSEKVWERPINVGFPFVSRQVSNTKRVVFYTKYSQEGSVLIGDFPVQGSQSLETPARRESL